MKYDRDNETEAWLKQTEVRMKQLENNQIRVRGRVGKKDKSWSQ